MAYTAVGPLGRVTPASAMCNGTAWTVDWDVHQCFETPGLSGQVKGSDNVCAVSFGGPSNVKSPPNELWWLVHEPKSDWFYYILCNCECLCGAGRCTPTYAQVKGVCCINGECDAMALGEGN